MPSKLKKNTLSYRGCNYMKHRLLLSTLSGKPVTITNIRINHDEPEHEVSLIRLLDKLTNGSQFELNDTGTVLSYTPGLLIGGELEHDCSLQRGIGYYLEAVMILAPFCKHPIDIKLRGVTNNTIDPSVDRIKSSGLPILKKFIIGDCDLDLTIKKRGALPKGGGEVHFKCPVNRGLRTIQFEKCGPVKEIRGVSCSMNVSPDIATRMYKAAKRVLNNFTNDVYLRTDGCQGKLGGNSPGYGISLTAVTTGVQGESKDIENKTRAYYTSEACCPPMDSNSISEEMTAEYLGEQAAYNLLEEIHRGGCIDSIFQPMTALFMALGQKNVSKVLSGPLTQSTIQFLRDLRDFMGVVFKLDPAKDPEDEDIVLEQVHLACMGIGYNNFSRRVL
ncbi:RNA 3'-terminal phosphate cyclase-like protein isoform X2 [Aphidius gifuensis]|uniref:RNA 3'-terminal phosphate cyclase-like protein isoform X2 n=1 Tax=Aphidius gifuensis TaxID=684658 RepID=UPI001CDC29B3|nr:RNA 3'-terminal phosphate cyclase-like protein isoform X2 [Aphidius gifuensis]